MKPANVVMLPVFLLMLVVPRLSALAQSETDTKPKTVTVKLGDPEHAEAADINRLGESIRQEVPVPFKDGLAYFFGDVAKVCLAAGAPPELRQAYFEEARRIYLYTGYKNEQFLEGAAAFHVTNFHFDDQPREVLFGRERTAREILPSIDGLSDVLIAESLASRLHSFRSDDILGWYGIGEDLHNRVQYGSATPEAAASRRVYQAFGEELAKAAAKAIAVEKLIGTPDAPKIPIGREYFRHNNLRLELPITLLMRLELLDYYNHRYDDIGEWGVHSKEEAERNKLSATALEYGMTMLLGVEGDDRYSATVYAYLAMGPGYHGGYFDQLFAYANRLPFDREKGGELVTNARNVASRLGFTISQLEAAGWTSPGLQEVKKQVPVIAARIEKGALTVAPFRVDKFTDPAAEERLTRESDFGRVGEW